MKRYTLFVAAVLATGRIIPAIADPSDTESFEFDPNNAIYSEHVAPSVDSLAFNPDSAIYSEDVNVVITSAAQNSERCHVSSMTCYPAVR